jgi:hypothetical protein
MVVCIRITSFQHNLGFQNQPTLSTELITQSVQQAMNWVKLPLTFQLLEGVEFL